jgi:tRNA (pseudouridine54-N1)-methyltransferase
MRIFVFYSNTVRTDGEFKDIYRSGRIDVLVNSLIHAFFISNGLRKNVVFDLSLNGPPIPPIRLKIESNPRTPWSKKDVTSLLASSLKKFRRKSITNPFPGVTVEKRSFRELIEDYAKSGRNVYVLDKSGEFIEDVEIKNPVFVIGDFLGIPKKELKWLKDKSTFVSLGDLAYFSSQTIVILNWLLDKMNYYKDFYPTEDKFRELKKKLKI